MKHIAGAVRGNAVSYLALFIALSGTSYAAVTIPRNAIGANQIRTGAVGSSEVKNGSLRVGDLDEDARDALEGARGPAGPTGAKGDPGRDGVNGTNGTNGTNGSSAASAVFARIEIDDLAGTYYAPISGSDTAVTAPFGPSKVQMTSPPVTTTVRDFVFNVMSISAAPNSAPVTIELRRAGSATPLVSCSAAVAGTGSGSCQDTTTTASVPANSLLHYQVTTPGGVDSGTVTYTAATFRLVEG